MVPLQGKKLLIAATIGSIFELFDFLSFIFLSPILAKVFFPNTLHNQAMWFTYLTISIGYLLRPVGGIILGNLGDKYGRKTTFSISILLMSLPSLVIGLLPTYAQIGYLAPIILVIARILQGVSLGGEVPGAIAFISEKFKHRNYFFACSWMTFGANISVVICSQTIKLITQHANHDFMYSYGWRIPFIAGSMLAIIGFYIRKSINESEAYQQIKQQKRIERTPLIRLLKEHWQMVVCGLFLSIIVSLITSIFHVFLPNLFTNYFHFNLSDTNGVTTLGAGTLAILSLLFAYLTKYTNPLNIIQFSLVALFIALLLIFLKIVSLGTINSLYVWIFVISACLSGINGIFFAVLADIFPPEVRYSGIAACYNIAYILGAGITPIWTSSILEATGSYHWIIFTCLIGCILSSIATLFIRKSAIIKSNHCYS